MPSYIIKLNKEEDLYVYWSEIVEAPHCWGTRDEVTKYMTRIGESKDLDARFARADEHGTSAFAYADNYGWDSKGVIIFMQQGYLYRDELKSFLESYNGNFDFDAYLLHPFDDEEEEDV